MVKKIAYYINILRTKFVEAIWGKASVNSSFNGLCLVFHHVNPSHINTPESCQCTPDSFIKIIEGVQGMGYTIISLDELQLVVNKQLSKKFAIITFDDVPSDMYEYAYPYIKDKKIPFTVFVTTSFVGKEGYISMEQLREFSLDPLCTIGAHTITHPLLRFCKDKEKEIVDGGAELERMINRKIEYFAFPFGSLYSTDHNSIRMAKNRYKYSFSTIDSSLNDYTLKKRGFLPRRAISDINEFYK